MSELYRAIAGSPITYLSSDISAAQTTISIADDSALPDAPNICTIGYGENIETIRYGAKSNGVLQNVTRGLEGTPRAWKAGTEVARFYTAYEHNAIVETIESHLADYAKGTMIRISLKISANSGNGVVDYQLGEEYVQSVVSSAYGIDINFKNIPTGAKLSSNFVIASSEGLSIGGSDINPFIYQRALSNIVLQLGIKNSPTSGHRPWNNVAKGSIQVTIAW